MVKNCIKTCTIFYIFLLTYFFIFTFTLFYNNDLKTLNNLLNKKQLEIYNFIKKERLKHFFIGLSVGGILGFLIMITKITPKFKFCLSGITVILFTSIIYYILPKSTYLIKHLTSKKQKEAWMNISSNFIKKKIAGFLLAVIIYFCIPFIINV